MAKNHGEVLAELQSRLEAIERWRVEDERLSDFNQQATNDLRQQIISLQRELEIERAARREVHRQIEIHLVECEGVRKMADKRTSELEQRIGDVAQIKEAVLRSSATWKTGAIIVSAICTLTLIVIQFLKLFFPQGF